MAAIAIGQRSLGGAPATNQPPNHVVDDTHRVNHTGGLPAVFTFRDELLPYLGSGHDGTSPASH